MSNSSRLLLLEYGTVHFQRIFLLMFSTFPIVGVWYNSMLFDFVSGHLDGGEMNIGREWIANVIVIFGRLL